MLLEFTALVFCNFSLGFGAFVFSKTFYMNTGLFNPNQTHLLAEISFTHPGGLPVRLRIVVVVVDRSLRAIVASLLHLKRPGFLQNFRYRFAWCRDLSSSFSKPGEADSSDCEAFLQISSSVAVL